MSKTIAVTPHIGNRSGVDFSKHEVIITQNEFVNIWYLKKPKTMCDSIKYINTNGILAVTGDYGNWIFCREFHPGPTTSGVSDGYWEEKLQISSTQQPEEYDSVNTQSAIEAMLNGGLQEYGYTDQKLEKMKTYMEGCLERVEDELDYTNFAYREGPSFIDHESVILVKKTKYWLTVVFDGFEEICERYNTGVLKLL